jgi:hypothetical protein
LIYVNSFDLFAQDAWQSTRPYFSQYPTYGVSNQVESNGSGNYNSLQTTLRTSNYHGLSTLLNYTWSHSLDDMTVYRSNGMIAYKIDVAPH